MGCDEIIEAVLAPRTKGFWKFGWQLRHALNSTDVIFLFSRRKGRPGIISVMLTSADITHSPFPSNNNVQRIASLPLSGLLGSMVGLLVETCNTSVDIRLKDLSSKAEESCIQPRVQGECR